MRKSSPRTQNYRDTGSPYPDLRARFQQQMADFARGERLRQLREAKHASQENVAFEIGVSTKTIRAWEHGGRIRWENAKRLGVFFEEDPETLVSRESAAPADGVAPKSQLDRIEGQVSRIHDLLLGDDRQRAAAILRELADRLEEEDSDGSRSDQAHGQP